MTEGAARDDDRVSLHPLDFEEAVESLLSVGPENDGITAEWLADFMDAVVERDPRSKLGLERTSGFLNPEEMQSRPRND